MADEEPENEEEEEEQTLIDRQIRTHKALQHMERELQLPSAIVMPTLLKLMKAYDGKWEFIEADNYHVLVDTIFATQESDEEQKNPGSSSGSGKKRRERKPSMRGSSSRRGVRNSKRAESEDSDEIEGSPELVRRGRGRGRPSNANTNTRPPARPNANSEGAKRKALVLAEADDREPLQWETLLALPAPLQCAFPQTSISNEGGQGPLRRNSTGEWVRGEPVTSLSKQTQTDDSCFHDCEDSIETTALICYEEFPAENSNGKETITTPASLPLQLPAVETKRAPVVVKQERSEPVFLSDSQVRRQILGQGTMAAEMCNKCDKPRPVCDKPRPAHFNPKKVKIEGAQQPGIHEGQEPPGAMVCLNPEPLQMLVPLPLPLPAGNLERENHRELHDPEPLLLTFPNPMDSIEPADTIAVSDTIAAATAVSEVMPASETTAVSEPVAVTEENVAAQIATDALRELVPCSETSAVDTDCCSTMEMACQTVLEPTVEPASEVATAVVEDPLPISSALEVKEFPKLDVMTSLTEVHDQVLPIEAGCENFTSEGALAALASYSSESEHTDVDMVPQHVKDQLPSAGHVREEVNTSSCGGNEEVDQKKDDALDTLQGILLLAVPPALEKPRDERLGVESFPEQSRDSCATMEGKQTQPLVPPVSLQPQQAEAKQTQPLAPPVMLQSQQAEAKQTQPIAPAATTQPQQTEASSEAPGTTTTKYTETTTPNEDPKQSSEAQTSSESSRKRKRTLVKLKDLEDDQSREHNPELDRHQLPVPERHNDRDISRGKEKVPISLWRDSEGTMTLPEAFFYINSSVVFQSAHVGVSMARVGEDDRCSGCVGDCLDNRVPCECTRLTDGEYAYTVEGCLYPHFLKQELERKRNLNLLSYCQPGACPLERTNDEVCKGHVMRRFIKECWEKCGCTQLCGNRIVQRGVVHKLQVFWTDNGKGWGIRTLEPISAGSFVCEYVGEILTNTEMWHRNNDVHRKAQHHFSLLLDADWCSERYLKDEEALCLDGTCFGNVARFINHRCSDTNLIEIPVEIESPDHHYYHLAFFTSKDVKENEELTWDYGLDFHDKDHPVQAFECLCGSSQCRGKTEGKPWV